MDSESATTVIPRIDFSGLDLSSHGSGSWEAVRGQVLEALETHGFFQAVFEHRILPEQLGDLLGPPLEEMFGVAVENKAKITTDNHYESYIPGGGHAFDIVIIKDPSQLESVESFANVLWPQGNPSFCNKIWSISKPIGELELMIRKMIYEGLNIGQHFESHVEATRQVIRMVRYVPSSKEPINMPEHTDMNALSIVYQHEEQGLEVQNNSGQWIQAPKKSFMVFLGETIMAITNERMKPCLHQVKIPPGNVRYSVTISSHYKDGYMIETLEEFVDEEHPRVFNPIEYPPYMKFRITEAGIRAKCALKAYCGVDYKEDA